MKDRIPNRVRGTLWAKMLSVILLCAIGAAAVYAGGSWQFLNNVTMGQGNTSYLESDTCWRQTADVANNIVQDYIDYGSEYVDPQYTLDYTNVHYTLYELTSSGTWKEVSSNDSQSASVSDGYKLYYTDSQNYGLNYQFTYQESELKSSDNSSQYQIDVVVTEPLNAHDEIYYNAQIFNSLYPYRSAIEIAMPILLILFAAVLIFLFCCVGYRKGDDQIHETWLEKIPYELVLTFSAVATLVCMQCLTQVYNSTYNSMSGINFNLTVMCTILFLMLSGLSILVSMTTLAVRIKAHAFWKSTLVGKFCGLIGTWLAAISIVPRTALIAGIILVFMMFLLATDEFGLSLIADIIIAAFLIYRASQAKKVKDITHELALGNLDTPIDSAKLAGIYKEQAEDLNSIGDGMRKAVEQQMKSEHLKTELITNVSHDIKTPLTSVINYVDLLQKPHTEEEGKNYLEVLDRQARRLKKLTEDVVEASKASSGNISAELTPINVHEILEQSLAEYEDRLTAGKLTTITEVKDDPIYVMADGRLLWRVLSNLFSNLCKYALPDTRVYLTAQRVSNDMVEITVKNISRDPLNISKDELMQRFVRGDASRHTEGSGLGLSIAESLTQIMKGHFSIDIDGDLFKASVLLPQTSPLQIPTVEAETPDPDVPSAPAEEIHQETAEPVKTVSAEITDKTEKQAADSNKQ